MLWTWAFGSGLFSPSFFFCPLHSSSYHYDYDYDYHYYYCCYYYYISDFLLIAVIASWVLYSVVNFITNVFSIFLTFLSLWRLKGRIQNFLLKNRNKNHTHYLIFLKLRKVMCKHVWTLILLLLGSLPKLHTQILFLLFLLSETRRFKSNKQNSTCPSFNSLLSIMPATFQTNNSDKTQVRRPGCNQNSHFTLYFCCSWRSREEPYRCQ